MIHDLLPAPDTNVRIIPPSPTPSSSSPSATAAAGPPNSENLRCPRCDSSNTKFCYYNNYNLTQPRHFCKTCRRYWTKGGALRNVPIGGGCRKNRGSAVASASSVKSSSVGKLKTTVSQEIGKLSFCNGLMEPTVVTDPIMWPNVASSQNSLLLSLIRANQNQNPNPNQIPNSIPIKEEDTLFGSSRFMCLDPIRLTNQIHNNGCQEAYQRLRSSSSSSFAGYSDHSPVLLGNVASAGNFTGSSILESSPIAPAELGFWNPNFPNWSTDLPSAINGAYP